MVSDSEDCGEVESPVTKARRVTVVPLAGKTMLDEPRDFPFTIRLPAGALPDDLDPLPDGSLVPEGMGAGRLVPLTGERHRDQRAHRTGLTPTAHR
jgi:hypothetical protein